jgi:hypothetical protein
MPFIDDMQSSDGNGREGLAMTHIVDDGDTPTRSKGLRKRLEIADTIRKVMIDMAEHDQIDRRSVDRLSGGDWYFSVSRSRPWWALSPMSIDYCHSCWRLARAAV